MPNLNIHWKGYPHRRLPHIRAISTSSTSVRSRSIPRIVGADIIRRPLGAPLERERRNQRFPFRRRRARKSRSSSSAARGRTQASLTARQHIQVFGWDTDIARKANTPNTKSGASSIKARAEPQSPVAPTALKDIISKTTAIDSHDGAGSSSFRCRKPTQPENPYSLMHVAEVPVYWTIDKSTTRKKPSLVSSRALTRATKRIREYGHVGPLGPVSRRRAYYTPRQVARSRTYDSRTDPRILLDRQRPTKSFPNNQPATTHRTASRSSPSNLWQENPELRRILKSQVSQSKTSSQSPTPSMKSIAQTLLSDPASRTLSQRKVLKQFTKELELYLQAAKALPKQSLMPSPSATTLSAHTIEEFMPYKSQFRSAGLAVSAADQLRATSIMAKLKKAPSPPPTPPKDRKYVSRKSAVGKSKLNSVDLDKQGAQAHRHHKTDSLPSFDTGTTVMDFTPPHEQTGPRAARVIRRSSISSDHTIMAFTPPHEVPLTQPIYAPPPPPRALTKRSLPWLRKPVSCGSPPLASPNDKDIVTASTVKAKATNPSDVLHTFSVASNSAVKKTVDQPKDKSEWVVKMVECC
jgi:hypothetical protein